MAFFFGGVGDAYGFFEFGVHDPDVAAGEEGHLEAVWGVGDGGGGGEGGAVDGGRGGVGAGGDSDEGGFGVAAGGPAVEVEAVAEDEGFAVAGEGGEDDGVAFEPGDRSVFAGGEVVLREVEGAVASGDAIEA